MPSFVDRLRSSAAELPTTRQLASHVDLALSSMEQSLMRPIGLGDLCEA